DTHNPGLGSPTGGGCMTSDDLRPILQLLRRTIRPIAFFAFPLLVIGSVTINCGEIPASEPQSATEDGPIGECPPNPTCDDRDPHTRNFCLPICSASCKHYAISWGFWATPYVVASAQCFSIPLGSHTGLGLIGLRVAWDPRATAGAQYPWP